MLSEQPDTGNRKRMLTGTACPRRNWPIPEDVTLMAAPCKCLLTASVGAQRPIVDTRRLLLPTSHNGLAARRIRKNGGSYIQTRHQGGWMPR